MKTDTHIHDILRARQRFNEAILNRNVDVICSFFTADYYVITARGVQSHGVHEQRQRWTAAFQADPIMTYRRRTRKLRLSTSLIDTEELGNWVGKYSSNQQVALVAGVYLANWQKQEDGLWLIQFEVFRLLRTRTYNLRPIKV